MTPWDGVKSQYKVNFADISRHSLALLVLTVHRKEALGTVFMHVQRFPLGIDPILR